jgi:hypothetical protein
VTLLYRHTDPGGVDLTVSTADGVAYLHVVADDPDVGALGAELPTDPDDAARLLLAIGATIRGVTVRVTYDHLGAALVTVSAPAPYAVAGGAA